LDGEFLEARTKLYDAGMSDFTVEIEREDDGRWISEVTDLPGVLVYGASREEAVSDVPGRSSSIPPRIAPSLPYAIFYVIEPEAIVIMGVVHQARHPSTWQRRA